MASHEVRCGSGYGKEASGAGESCRGPEAAHCLRAWFDAIFTSTKTRTVHASFYDVELVGRHSRHYLKNIRVRLLQVFGKVFDDPQIRLLDLTYLLGT